MFFCKNQGGGWGGPIILNGEFTNCPPPQNRNFRLFQFPVISSQATWPAHPKILSKILFKFILRRWCPVCCFPNHGGIPPCQAVCCFPTQVRKFCGAHHYFQPDDMSTRKHFDPMLLNRFTELLTELYVLRGLVITWSYILHLLI